MYSVCHCLTTVLLKYSLIKTEINSSNGNIHIKTKKGEKNTSRSADFQPRVKDLWIKRMSCDLTLNIHNVFVWRTTTSCSWLSSLHLHSGFIVWVVLWSLDESKKRKEKAFLYYLKTTKIFFSIPACKLVHCACVSVDCLVISFYDNLHSFIVRDLACSFYLMYY